MLILLVSKYTPASSRAVIKKAAFCTTALPVGLSQWWQLVSISISARFIVSCPIPRIGLAMPGPHREVPLLGEPLSRHIDSERLTTKAALRQSVEELTLNHGPAPSNTAAPAQDATVLTAKSKQHSRQNDPLRHCPHCCRLTAHIVDSWQVIAMALPHLSTALPAKVDRVARALSTIR